MLAQDLTSSNFIIRGPSLSPGSKWSTSDSFQTSNLLGQSTIGTSTSASFENQTGFSFIHDPQFYVTAPGSMNYSAASVSTVSQVITAILDSVNVVNTRGTNTAWSLSATVTNLTTTRSVTKLLGSNNTVTFSGTYSGVITHDLASKYFIEITTGGAVGAAILKWTDPAGTVTQNITTASSILLNNGMTVNFAAATYVVGDKWMLPVDSLDYTALTLTPGSITVNFGNTSVTVGGDGLFGGISTTSSSRILMSANANAGEGSYTQAINFSQNAHANFLFGNYSATITITLS